MKIWLILFDSELKKKQIIIVLMKSIQQLVFDF
jgi:hypothetical protein